MDLQVFRSKSNLPRDFVDQRFERRELPDSVLRKDEFQSLDVFMNGSRNVFKDVETHCNGHVEAKPRYTRYEK